MKKEDILTWHIEFYRNTTNLTTIILIRKNKKASFGPCFHVMQMKKCTYSNCDLEGNRADEMIGMVLWEKCCMHVGSGTGRKIAYLYIHANPAQNRNQQ